MFVSEPNYLPFKVQAKANYQARSNNELSLTINKIYSIIDTDKKGLWWKAVDENQIGWVPAAYTTVLPKPIPKPLVKPAIPSIPKPTIYEYKLNEKIIELHVIESPVELNVYLKNPYNGITEYISKIKTNVLFKIGIDDPEKTQILLKYNRDEIKIELRASVRNFDYPKQLIKNYTLGSHIVKIGLQYKQPEFSNPVNINHVSHIGIKNGIFSANNIPEHWKNQLKSSGFKKSDLNDEPFRNKIFDILSTNDNFANQILNVHLPIHVKSNNKLPNELPLPITQNKISNEELHLPHNISNNELPLPMTHNISNNELPLPMTHNISNNELPLPITYNITSQKIESSINALDLKSVKLKPVQIQEKPKDDLASILSVALKNNRVVIEGQYDDDSEWE